MPVAALLPIAGAIALTTSAAALSASGGFTVAAIGDVLPGESYERTIRAGRDPFAGIAPFLRSTDLALANLEGPLTARGRRVEGKRFTFRSPPARARMLANAGLDAVGLANNHIMDFGPDGLADTLAALDAAGVARAGAGPDAAAARRPATLAAGGARVAFLSYNRTFPLSYNARARAPGTASADEVLVAADVAAARRDHDAVIVMVHWGREKTHALREYQRPVARAAIHAGAALVLGAHPHVPQGVERIGAGVAAYSLGDGVFGGARKRSLDSLALRARFGPQGLEAVELFALQASNADTLDAPALRTAPDAAGRVLDLVRSLSAELGTALVPAMSAEGWPCLTLNLAGS